MILLAAEGTQQRCTWEMSYDTGCGMADDAEYLIAHQVFSGLAVCMAILYRAMVGYSEGPAAREVL